MSRRSGHARPSAHAASAVSNAPSSKARWRHSMIAPARPGNDNFRGIGRRVDPFRETNQFEPLVQ